MSPPAQPSSRFIQTDSGLLLDGQRFTVHVANAQNPNRDVIEQAYASFLNHAGEIFGNPAVNADGKSIFGDIETPAVFGKLIHGHASAESYSHHGVAVVACDAKGTPVAFRFGIYHAGGAANRTYAGTDEIYRHRGLGGILLGVLEEKLQHMARAHGQKEGAPIFIECERDNKDLIQTHLRHGMEIVPGWETPILIADQDGPIKTKKGSFSPQELVLLAHFPAGATNEQKAAHSVNFLHNFFSLYKEGFYPDTPSLDFRSPMQTKRLLVQVANAMRAHFGVPGRGQGRRPSGAPPKVQPGEQ